MVVSVKVKTNTEFLKTRLKKVERKIKSIIEKGILQGGFQLLDIIRTKTAKGIDFRDRPFAPYSQGYLKKLNKEGKSTKVDLFYSGRMLGALTPSGQTVRKTGTNKVSVGFSNGEMIKRAVFNQVLGKNKREFFGFNDRTANIIGKQFNKFVAKEFRKAKI